MTFAPALAVLPELGPPGWVAFGLVGLGYGAYAGYRWYQSRSDSAQDGSEADKANDKAAQGDQAQACSTCKPKNSCEHLRKRSGDGKYRGGAHGDPKKDVGTSSPSGDELDSHYIPSKGSYAGSGLSPEDGPAIQVEPGDHKDTSTYGFKGIPSVRDQRSSVAKGGFSIEFEKDIQEMKDIAAKAGDPHKYYQAINEMREYKECLEKNNLLPGQGKAES